MCGRDFGFDRGVVGCMFGVAMTYFIEVAIV
jgi:hypothetical protein